MQIQNPSSSYVITRLSVSLPAYDKSLLIYINSGGYADMAAYFYSTNNMAGQYTASVHIADSGGYDTTQNVYVYATTIPDVYFTVLGYIGNYPPTISTDISQVEPSNDSSNVNIQTSSVVYQQVYDYFSAPPSGQGTVTLSIKRPGQTLNFTSRLVGSTAIQYIDSDATINIQPV